MKIGVLSVGVVGFLALFVFLLQGEQSITNYPPQNDRVITFGDSLVEGIGSTEGNDFVSVLSEKIGRPIENYGVSGNTTADGVARVEEVA